MKELELKYNISDFTFINYTYLLKLGLKSYNFIPFNYEKLYKKNIILRHDLEFSVNNALKMAELESALGITATYFIQLHSEFYNTLEKDTVVAIRKIIQMKHQIGLHFDCHFWDIRSEEQLERFIKVDKKVLEQYLDIEIKVFSFHNNTPFTLSCRKEKYAGLLNVYSDYFRQNFGYNSDSLGYWRFERLEDRLISAKDDNLQVLIHDGMWQDEVLPPRRRIHKVIDENALNIKNRYDSFLAAIGAKNIDWD